jgi:hypothetical protein
VQLRKYALKYNLPMTLSDEKTYHILRDGITGGLANVGHRYNYAGETKINRFYWESNGDGTNKMVSRDTEWVMTHVCGCDWSSLYPSACSSNPHPFIPYTGRRMWMPGYEAGRLDMKNSTQDEMRRVILTPDRWECESTERIERLPWFIAVVKGHIDEEYLNDYINFAPVIKRLEIRTDKQTIGEYMYSHLRQHKLPTGKKETKLTQLLSTHNRFESLGMYELWGLVDDCRFVIDEIQSVVLFTKHTRIGSFVNYFFNKRVSAKTQGEKALDKNILNSSYGSDGMNAEKFMDVRFMGKEKALHATVNSNFVSSTEIAEDLYMVEREPLSAPCRKPLQTAYATLSNAKYLFVMFVYKFLYRCLDANRFHFINCDTDSYMFAVSDTGERRRVLERITADISQGGKERLWRRIVPHFEDIVKDREFYEKNYSVFFPKKKTLLCLEYEHCAKNMIALCAKNYWHTDGKEGLVKLKGVSTRGCLNRHINELSFSECIKEGKITGAENYVLRQRENKMTKQIIRKTGISGVHTKMVVMKNEACMPFMFGVNADRYVVE